MATEKAARNREIYLLVIDKGISYKDIMKLYGFRSKKSVYTIIRREANKKT